MGSGESRAKHSSMTDIHSFSNVNQQAHPDHGGRFISLGEGERDEATESTDEPTRAGNNESTCNKKLSRRSDMTEEDINNWQPDRNPFQPYRPQGDRPAMSDQEALDKIPDKINMAQLAELQRRNANAQGVQQATGNATVHHQDDWLNPDTSGIKPSPVYNDVTRPSTPEDRQFDAASKSSLLAGLGIGASYIPHPLAKLAAVGLGMASAITGTMGGEYFGSPTHTDYDPQRWLDKSAAGEVD